MKSITDLIADITWQSTEENFDDNMSAFMHQTASQLGEIMAIGYENPPAVFARFVECMLSSMHGTMDTTPCNQKNITSRQRETEPEPDAKS